MLTSQALTPPYIAQPCTVNHPPTHPRGRIPPAGDGEDLLASFTERLLEAKRQLAPAGGGPASRAELLLTLAQVPGVYVPQLYSLEYESPTGPLASIKPAEPGVPAVVQKQTYRGNTLASSTGGLAGGWAGGRVGGECGGAGWGLRGSVECSVAGAPCSALFCEPSTTPAPQCPCSGVQPHGLGKHLHGGGGAQLPGNVQVWSRWGWMGGEVGSGGVVSESYIGSRGRRWCTAA